MCGDQGGPQHLALAGHDSTEGQQASHYEHGEEQAALPGGQGRDTGLGLSRVQFWYSSFNGWNDYVMDDCATMLHR